MVDNSPRQDVLYKAIEVITGDRNMQYDEPSRNFEVIAELWAIYLGIPVQAHDVAILNILQKVSRAMTSPDKEDHWIDLAGYAACGWETLA